ncbi:sensor histidine kinase [Pedobacter arcticus]|uniref:sensor histidine kinase n=1 Tax=Pedobacter arcticus TaxID=752140 RepID=UPI0002DFA8CF|nr:HAMP domain-containing sensor histidine kinase [Pedobacter arcticus]
MPTFKLSISTLLKGKYTFWSRLIGRSSKFPLETRIFHSISLGLIVVAVVYIPYNFFAGLYVSSLSALLIALFFTQQYYYSRFLNVAHSNIAFGLVGMLIFGVNYFSNSGINGSTDLIWPIHLLLVLAITPYRQHLKWGVLYLLFFTALHIFAYQFPALVKHPFSAGKAQLIDRITAFPMPIFVVYIIINFIRKSYDKERKIAEEKNLAIEVSNEQITLQKDQLEKSNIEKNKLMSIISHDFRTPLLNVQNYLELINEYGLDSAERLALEKNLLNATNNAMEMLTNVLHWSKSQMEGANVNMVELNLLCALESTLEMESLHAFKKGITLSYDIPAQLLITADKDMLQLVVRNLISNAIKFTEKGGLIKLEAQLLDKECKITVSDNGSGIPQTKKDDIFSVTTNPTFGTNNEKGAGLGLVLCKEYTERQGGRIGFESEEGTGSQFFIFIPSAI